MICHQSVLLSIGVLVFVFTFVLALMFFPFFALPGLFPRFLFFLGSSFHPGCPAMDSSLSFQVWLLFLLRVFCFLPSCNKRWRFSPAPASVSWQVRFFPYREVCVVILCFLFPQPLLHCVWTLRVLPQTARSLLWHVVNFVNFYCHICKCLFL